MHDEQKCKKYFIKWKQTVSADVFITKNVQRLTVLHVRPSRRAQTSVQTESVVKLQLFIFLFLSRQITYHIIYTLKITRLYICRTNDAYTYNNV